MIDCKAVRVDYKIFFANKRQSIHVHAPRSYFGPVNGLYDRTVQDLEQPLSLPSRSMVVLLKAIEIDSGFRCLVEGGKGRFGTARCGAGRPQLIQGNNRHRRADGPQIMGGIRQAETANVASYSKGSAVGVDRNKIGGFSKGAADQSVAKNCGGSDAWGLKESVRPGARRPTNGGKRTMTTRRPILLSLRDFGAPCVSW